MDDFKITIAAARTNAHKTIRGIAEALHVSPSTVMNWEHGKRSPSVEKAQQFCEICNIPFDRVTFLRDKNANK